MALKSEVNVTPRRRWILKGGFHRPNSVLVITVSLLAGIWTGRYLEKRTTPIEVAPYKAKQERWGPIDRSPYFRGQKKGAVGLYLDLMKLSLTDLIDENDPGVWQRRSEGRDQGGKALTMIGLRRLDNIQALMEDVLERDIPGDFIEAGAWRGGATIFMRALLKAHNVRDRDVWVADSFEGLPEPNADRYPIDKNMDFSKIDHFVVSVEEVRNNFEKYGLLDDQVRFLKGWFRDTFPGAPIVRLAILRIDADLYESTMDALVHLYPKVSPGGYIIVDDYGCFEACRKAVEDFMQKIGIAPEIHKIDWTGVYWMKEVNPPDKQAKKCLSAAVPDGSITRPR